MRSFLQRLKGFFAEHGPASLFSGAVILGVSSVASRVLGLVRDRLLAREFGAGFELDAYNAAFRVPDFLFNLLVLGALSSAFIPVFADYLAKQKRDEAFVLARSLFTVMFLVLAVLVVVSFIFAESFSYIVAPTWDSAQRSTLTALIRIMLLSPLFFGLSNVLTGILNGFRRFVATAFAPVMYNVGIVIGILVFVPIWGISGVGWGVVLGAVLHLLVQVPTSRRLGFSFVPSFQFFHEGVRRIIKLLLPRTVGMAMTQINLLIIAFLATRLPEPGALTHFTFATNLQSFPLGVFGFSFAVSAFPHLAEAASKNRGADFQEAFSHAFTQILFWLLPASVFIMLLREHIVRLTIGSGAFDWTDTIFTAQALGFLALSLFAQGLVPLLARAFYALQDTKTPVIVSIIALVANIGLSFWLAPEFGVVGLALAFTVGTLLNVLILLIWLRARVGDLSDAQLLRNTITIVFASIIGGIVALGLVLIIDPFVDTTRYVGLAIQASAALLGGGIVYIAICSFLRLPELGSMLRAMRRRLGAKNA